MKYTVAAEHFGLTEALNESVKHHVSKLDGILPEETVLHVFLSKDSADVFTALYRVHANKTEVICRESSRDLYVAISHGLLATRRRLIKMKKEKIRSRSVRMAG